MANSLIETYLPNWDGFFGLLLTAVVVTIIFVLVAVISNNTTNDLDRELEKLKDEKNEEDV
ncbi:MAG: hypothetical protein GY705_07735 [Bacteroidetes bacterium]|nr:hypothetical protein [Bacteroidota bacterium]